MTILDSLKDYVWYHKCFLRIIKLRWLLHFVSLWNVIVTCHNSYSCMNKTDWIFSVKLNLNWLYLEYNGAPGIWLSLFHVIVTMVKIWPYCTNDHIIFELSRGGSLVAYVLFSRKLYIIWQLVYIVVRMKLLMTPFVANGSNTDHKPSTILPLNLDLGHKNIYRQG